MKKTTVIYHRADFDGLFCREIAHKFLPDAELIGWDYGDPLVPMPDGQLYILDLSPDCCPESLATPHGHGRLIWIDHHKSAIEKLPNTISGYRIDGVAACRLAWQWFKAWGRYLNQTTDSSRDIDWFQSHYPLPQKTDFIDRKVEEPLAVRLAGEYDIWDKRDPDAELFQHGLRSRDLDQNAWERLLMVNDESLEVPSLLLGGKAIQYFQERQNQSIITSYGFNVEWEGLVFLACNHARFNSQLFTAGIKPSHDALLGFNWTGEHWRVSLYHAPGKEQHDLSQIAVKHGGGGHRGACGFRCDKLPFIT